MNTQRASNQTLIAVAIHRKLLAAMDKACEQSGEGRSTFVRRAIFNVIKAKNGVVLEEWVKRQVRVKGEPHFLPKPEPVAPAARTKAASARKITSASARKR